MAGENNTENSIQSMGIPTIQFGITPSAVVASAVDPNLTNAGEAADAQAVGNKFAEVEESISNLAVEVSHMSDLVPKSDIETTLTTEGKVADSKATGDRVAAVETAIRNDIDATLTGTGKFADAKAVGDRLSTLSSNISDVGTVANAAVKTVESIAPVSGNVSLSSLVATDSELLGMIEDVIAGANTHTARANAIAGPLSIRTALTAYHAALVGLFPQRHVINVAIPAGVTTVTIDDTWVTADTDCYAHTLDAQGVATTVSWSFSSGRIVFQLGEALSTALTFSFGMIKGGV